MKDIHGIRSPVQTGFDPLILKIVFMLSAGLLLLILIFFLIKKLWKKRQQPKNLKFLPAPLPPFETAFKLLDQLKQNTLIDPRLFYFDLTAILRNYIGQSFNINAMEMTSQEFIKNINVLNIDKGTKKNISNFLNRSDAFKYAGITPQKSQANKDISSIRDKIDEIERSLVKTNTSFPAQNDEPMQGQYMVRKIGKNQYQNRLQKWGEKP
jgi:hypothetical protein